MTLTEAVAEEGTGDPVVAPEAMFSARGDDTGSSRPGGSFGDEEGELEPAAPVGRTALAAFSALAAAGVMLGALFEGLLATAVGVGSVGLGVGLTVVSVRLGSTTVLQWFTVPVAALAGAAVAAPVATGGVISGVRSVLDVGGLGDPPVPFEAGWRFLLVAVMTIISAAVVALAMSFRRPAIAVFAPVAVAFAALLFQPGHASPAPTIVALILIIGGLLVSYGGELAAEGATSARFEARRLLRGAGTLVVLAAVVTGITRVGVLFPAPPPSEVVPPTRLQPPPPQDDQKVFDVLADGDYPWRLGVLDTYDGSGWRTAPRDRRRLVSADGDVPFAAPATQATTGEPVGSVTGGGNEKITVEFTVTDLPSRDLPTPANATAVTARGGKIQYDPRTQTLSVAESKAPTGLRYTVTAWAPPTQAQLEAAPAPPESMTDLLVAPRVPPGVAALLEDAPSDRYTRMQFLRTKLLTAVTARGNGDPSVDVTANRVDQLIGGGTGSPFEITASEALLARWAGVPARIGYGFYGGDLPGGATAASPKAVFLHHGASWLEVYFQGFGWVAIVGQPQKATGSLDNSPKRQSESLPDRNFALSLYVPVQQQTPALLFELVRFWLLRVAPLLLGTAAMWWGYPGLLKALRAPYRRRWARRRGPRARIGAAYAAWRDAATDMNVGHHALTPIQFLQAVDKDREHSELAWLVTRSLWGDLGRDISLDDADAAERLAASVTRRLRQADSFLNVLIAFASRASLRDPYDADLPNLWRQRRRAPATRNRVLDPVRTAGPILLVGLVLVVSLVAVARSVDRIDLAEGDVESILPSPPAPPELHGLTLRRVPAAEREIALSGPSALVQDPRVFTLDRPDGTVVGMVQMAPFKPGLRSRQASLRAQLLREIAAGSLEVKRRDRTVFYTGRLDELQVFAYLPASGAWFEIMLLKSDVGNGEQIFTRLIEAQTGLGESGPAVEGEGDARRGLNS